MSQKRKVESPTVNAWLYFLFTLRFQEHFLEEKNLGHLVLLDLLKKVQENAYDTPVSFFQM